MFSTTTSLTLTSSSSMALPRGDFRLSVTPFLHEFSSMKNHESSPRLSDSAMRPGSPVGGSILMTSAPSHASICVLLGPASYCVRSSTRIPSSALGMRSLVPFHLKVGGLEMAPPTPMRSSRRVCGEADGLGAGRVVGDDVDDGGLAGGEGAFQGWADVVGFFDVLAVGAEVHREPIVAREAEIAARLGQRPRPLGVRGPAAVVADDAYDVDLVAHRRVDVHRVDAERAVAVQHQHM